MYVSLYVYVFETIYVHMHVFMYVRIYLYSYMGLGLCVCVYACMLTNLHVAGVCPAKATLRKMVVSTLI